MNMNRLILGVLLFAWFPFYSAAQAPVRTEKQKIERIGKIYSDSLQQLKTLYNDWKYEEADTLSNPYYFRLFASPTFYEKAVKELFSLSTPEDDYRAILESKALISVYAQRPWLIQNLNDTIRSSTPSSYEQIIKPNVQLSKQVEEKTNEEFNLQNLDIVVHRPSFWTFRANVSFQLMQNYVSDNWYKGGESNHSFLTTLNVQANFDNKQKITFNNYLEMKFGLQSSNSDTEHRYKTNTDLLRLTNELGIKASKHWYYSAMLQSWTQFYRSYKKNEKRVRSDFMSPFESLFTLGMKYSLHTKNNRFNVNANLSPFACDFKYVSRMGLAPSFGVKPNHHTRFDYGSNITITAKWTPWKNVTWDSRLFYYTNYKYAQIEWENTIYLRINRFLSTKLFLYPRFDDNVRRKDSGSYFQFNEFLSVGIDYSF